MLIKVIDQDGSKLFDYSGTMIPAVGTCLVLSGSDDAQPTTLQVLNSTLFMNTAGKVNYETHVNVWVKVV